MTARALRLGTRGSRLALWQAQTVTNRLQAAGAHVEIIVIKTSGDRLQSRPLSESGTKRLFVKEIEDALLSGDVDLAVHSAKDMPATLPDGLEVGAALPREDPRDAIVLAASRDAGRSQSRARHDLNCRRNPVNVSGHFKLRAGMLGRQFQQHDFRLRGGQGGVGARRVRIIEDVTHHFGLLQRFDQCSATHRVRTDYCDIQHIVPRPVMSVPLVRSNAGSNLMVSPPAVVRRRPWLVPGKAWETKALPELLPAKAA